MWNTAAEYLIETEINNQPRQIHDDKLAWEWPNNWLVT